MTSGPAARRRVLRLRRRWLPRLLLAAGLVVVVLSVVGMHQLSFGHDAVTGPSTSSTHAESMHGAVPGETQAAATAGSLASHLVTGTPLGEPVDGCPDCSDHLMAFGSCLLALTLLVLSWLLTPPRPRQVPPSLVPRQPLAPGLFAAGRHVPSLSLAELSLLRT